MILIGREMNEWVEEIAVNSSWIWEGKPELGFFVWFRDTTVGEDCYAVEIVLMLTIFFVFYLF